MILWSLLRGSILWIVWIDQNVVCFKVEAPIRKLYLFSQSIKAPKVPSMHTQK
jgi:hypothetical protein